MLEILDYIGVFVFAINGFLVGIERRLDFMGCSIVGFTTAIGGGTIRDVILGISPVAWISTPIYVYLILIAIICCVCFKRFFVNLRKSLMFFDTIGISTFTIIGLLTAHNLGFPFYISIMMGTVTAVFGGMLRDVFTSNVPMILTSDFYASTTILGGITFFLCSTFLNINLCIVFGFASTFTLRILAIRFNWKLPKF